MKTRQVCELLIGLPLLFLCLSGLTYFLGTLNLRLALVVEFTLLGAIIIGWFALFDRVLTHT
ncbi:hypothetical protein [Cyanothece sp. BG0011]|uniref:hypothetical protein n=1 Tax=Cyanothece sp. BG0011 TaxID=2082950 RepID=UPI000D1ECE53|nr:hypothetical protein [Cyanothece sp. BG0011]